MNRNDKPLVYSCSGGSSAAQLANALAIKLDRAGIGDMACIAGVGAPALHFDLHEQGVKKKLHEDFDPAQADALVLVLAGRICQAEVRGDQLHPVDAEVV